jgi:hypothetical protein
VAASLVASTITTKETQNQIQGQGLSADYAVALLPGAGPVLQVTVKDSQPERAVATRNRVMELMEAELLRIQKSESVPDRHLIHARANSAPNAADVLPGSKIRALAGIGGLGGVLTLMIAFALDRRRPRRAERPVARELPTQPLTERPAEAGWSWTTAQSTEGGQQGDTPGPPRPGRRTPSHRSAVGDSREDGDTASQSQVA